MLSDTSLGQVHKHFVSEEQQQTSWYFTRLDLLDHDPFQLHRQSSQKNHIGAILVFVLKERFFENLGGKGNLHLHKDLEMSGTQNIKEVKWVTSMSCKIYRPLTRGSLAQKSNRSGQTSFFGDVWIHADPENINKTNRKEMKTTDAGWFSNSAFWTCYSYCSILFLCRCFGKRPISTSSSADVWRCGTEAVDFASTFRYPHPRNPNMELLLQPFQMDENTLKWSEMEILMFEDFCRNHGFSDSILPRFASNALARAVEVDSDSFQLMICTCRYPAFLKVYNLFTIAMFEVCNRGSI